MVYSRGARPIAKVGMGFRSVAKGTLGWQHQTAAKGTWAPPLHVAVGRPTTQASLSLPLSGTSRAHRKETHGEETGETRRKVRSGSQGLGGWEGIRAGRSGTPVIWSGPVPGGSSALRFWH